MAKGLVPVGTRRCRTPIGRQDVEEEEEAWVAGAVEEVTRTGKTGTGGGHTVVPEAPRGRGVRVTTAGVGAGVWARAGAEVGVGVGA